MIPAPRTPNQRRVLLREEFAMNVRIAGPTLARLECWMSDQRMDIHTTYTAAVDRLLELARANEVCSEVPGNAAQSPVERLSALRPPDAPPLRGGL